ncbi:MAG: hypothetical protein PHC92_11550, partial [Syntrophomonadaceae bacterium]|nr:hypothetical protein [Syntrophomonadaceae bacterium]
MKTKIIIVLTLLFMTLAVSSAAAAFSPQEWKYFKEIPAADEGFALIKVDTEIMKNSQQYFADLRVTDLEGKEIPSQIIQPAEEEVVSEVNLMDLMNYPDYASSVIDLGVNPQPHNRLVLNIKAAEDYLREVKLQASEDAQLWGDLVTARIFSYNGEQSNQISYPTSNMRYLRINIASKADEKPLIVASASLKFLPSNIYDGKLIASKNISNRSDKESTKLVVDLGAPNYIVNTIQIQTSDRNFNRNVVCYTANKSNVTGDETMLDSESILAYQWNNYQSVKDSIEINQFAQRYLILSIYNGSSPALKIKDIKIYGSQPVLIADLQGAARIWYANPKAVAPNYDLMGFASLIAKKDLQVLNAGTQQLNPDYKA